MWGCPKQHGLGWGWILVKEISLEYLTPAYLLLDTATVDDMNPAAPIMRNNIAHFPLYWVLKVVQDLNFQPMMAT